MPPDEKGLLARGRVPDPQRSILAPGGDVASVGAECHSEEGPDAGSAEDHRARMALGIEVMPLPASLLGRARIEQGRGAVRLILAPGEPSLVDLEEVAVAVGQLKRLL